MHPSTSGYFLPAAAFSRKGNNVRYEEIFARRLMSSAVSMSSRCATTVMIFSRGARSLQAEGKEH